MKISSKSEFFEKEIKFPNVEEAVGDALTPSSYSYNTTKEKLAVENSKLREMLSRFMECTYGEAADRPKHEQVKYILGYGYEVEE